MKPPPAPITPSGLAPTCPDVVGTTLLIQCINGWGWTQLVDGELRVLNDPSLLMSRIVIEPEAYVEFTTPRCGITGRVTRKPQGYSFTRFLAFIMSDGINYDFKERIAPCWRVLFGNGDLDLESTWFPTLKGECTIYGYGRVGQDADWLQQSGHLTL